MRREIHQVSCERIRDELSRMLAEGHTRRAFELLDISGCLKKCSPKSIACTESSSRRNFTQKATCGCTP